jgi:hypothetical protein
LHPNLTKRRGKENLPHEDRGRIAVKPLYHKKSWRHERSSLNGFGNTGEETTGTIHSSPPAKWARASVGIMRARVRRLELCTCCSI